MFAGAKKEVKKERAGASPKPSAAGAGAAPVPLFSPVSGGLTPRGTVCAAPCDNVGLLPLAHLPLAPLLLLSRPVADGNVPLYLPR